jgi:hypothetical protein
MWGVASEQIKQARLPVCQRQPPSQPPQFRFHCRLSSVLYTAMSRQPSPGPSHFPPSAQHANNRQKSKNYTHGIAAGAEDAKYKTKYRELKKKVKEIETVSQPNAFFV